MMFAVVTNKVRNQPLLTLVLVVLLSLVCVGARAAPSHRTKRLASRQSEDLLQLIRNRLEQSAAFDDYPGIRNFHDFNLPASQWLSRHPYYQQLLEEGGLDEDFGDGGVSMGLDSDDNDDNDVHKRGSETGGSVGLSQRRKDAKHMIHTIESLMHIGK